MADTICVGGHMADTDKREMIDCIMMALAKHGVNVDGVLRMAVDAVCDGYAVEKAKTDLIVYTGKNDMYLQRFVLSKVIAGCTKQTVRVYAREVGRILAEIGKDADTIEPWDIQRYTAVRLSRGVSKVTINNEQRYLSSFYAWMTREELVNRNPLLKVDRIKARPQKEKAFEDIDIEKMRACCRNNREKCLLEILMSTGCRVSEIIQIRMGDIDDGKVEILGKGEKWRTVYLNARAMVAIDMYTKERKDANPYLFPRGVEAAKVEKMRTLKHMWYTDPDLVDPQRPCDKSTIESIVRKLGRRCGIENVHPHRFRRTCATVAMKNGMPLELVSRMLGHESIATTQIYLDIRESELTEAHRKYIR